MGYGNEFYELEIPEKTAEPVEVGAGRVSLKEKMTDGNVRYAVVESERLGTYCEDGRRWRDWSVEERGELV